MDWRPPATFEEYRFLRRVGKGGMGTVYLAHDTLLDRLVAVKFINPPDPRSSVRERFLVEARAAARLQHPNVVSIYRVGHLDGRPFIISEFIRGTGLHQVPRPIAWRHVLEISIGMARGLAAAHRQGILHRDIKPANAILSEDGSVKILDFGLAKFLEANLSIIDLACRGEPGTPRSLVEDPATQPPPRSDRPVDTPSEIIGERGRDIPRDWAEIPPDHDSGPAPGTVSQSSSEYTVVRCMKSTSNPGTTVWGTPLYMAPEIWLGKPATRRSDVYSLGVVFYELCAGQAPHAHYPAAELSRAIVDSDARPLASAVSDIDPEFAAVIDRCLRRDSDERFASAEELRDALEELVATSSLAQVPEGNPYRGLLAFEAEHRALFFGRSSEVRTLTERLRSQSFVLVAGDSGVGKSSLCRAGVIPQVLEGGLSDGLRWNVIGFMPGVYPCHELAAALEPVLDTPTDGIADELHNNPHLLVRTLQTHLGDEQGLLIFIDQLEELVTVSNRSEEELFGELMSYLAEQFGNLRLLATVRSDFLARMAMIPVMGDEIARALYILRPLSPDNIRKAIVGPARAKGILFESETLVDMLVDSTTRTPGGLPLLQFALAELWDARATSTAPISAEAIDAIGGVDGALARHADSVILGLPREQRRAARSILTSLVTVEGTRTRRSGDELVAGEINALTALDALVHGRLLVARETDEGSVYELAHEALINGWETLQRWLDEDAESKAVKQRLDASAAEWERLGRSPEVLWSQRQVEEAEGVDRSALAGRERAFLTASERGLKRRRSVRNALLLGMPLFLLALYGAVQFKAASDLDQHVAAQVAKGREIYTQAVYEREKLDALRRVAFGAFDTKQRDQGESLWEQVLQMEAQIDLLFRTASQVFEGVLTVHGSRDDVRNMLGDILFERALLAEHSHNPSLRDELIQRLPVYDASGQRMRKWNAPAKVRIDSQPQGATVYIGDYVANEHGKLELTELRELGVTPLVQSEISQGSYMFLLRARGHVDVRYPILLGCDEDIHLDIPMPSISEIPEGFIYVPPGRFLFGSADQERVRRRFLNAVPAHQVTIGAYLIARYETTYAEWIEYIESLSPQAREHQTITAGKGGIGGIVNLEELPDGSWQLSIKPTSQSYTARTGQKIIYSSRTTRAEQDWQRFPVSGISFAEAAGYASWLDRTKRVPGARLCNEYEWERAARGADNRIFPHGNTVAPDDANIDETYGKMAETMGPDEVGSHPASRSPFGVEDMMGNIFEWTLSSVEPDTVLVRGGAYYYDETSALLNNRFILDSKLQDPTVGLRICVSLPAAGQVIN
ncbi:MAG: protein kinase [Proteobacteria bacterium]|nr:protein kinase [Pseudomonadota bacterium]